MTDPACKHQFGRRRDKHGALINQKGTRRCALCGADEVLRPQTALVEIRRANQEPNFGPAMLALTNMQQRFVLAMLEIGDGNYSEAYRAAGYSDSSQEVVKANAHKVAHYPAVQAAMHEEGQKRLNGVMPMALAKLVEFVQGSRNINGVVDTIPHKEQLKALEMVLNRVGMQATTKHEMVVEHRSNAEQIEKVKEMAAKLGLDPKQLLGQAGIVVDAEFTEVPTDA